MKNAKKNAIFLKLFWYKVFVPWKLNLPSFLLDSALIKYSLDFQIPRGGFRIPGIGTSTSSESRIDIFIGIPDSLNWSPGFKTHDSKFPQANISRIT